MQVSTAIAISPTFGRVTIEEFKKNILPLKDRLYRFALTFLHDEQTAEDVVQDVLIKSWESINSPTDIGNLEAYCITMTRNKSLDVLRKKGRNYVDVTEQIDLELEDLTPAQSMVSMDRQRIVHEAIQQLTDQQREVVILRDIQGHSYKEIADLVGINLNHVKVLLHRGRMSVKAFIEKHYGTIY